MDLDKFYLSLLEVLPKIFYVKFGLMNHAIIIKTIFEYYLYEILT